MSFIVYCVVDYKYVQEIHISLPKDVFIFKLKVCSSAEQKVITIYKQYWERNACVC